MFEHPNNDYVARKMSMFQLRNVQCNVSSVSRLYSQGLNISINLQVLYSIPPRYEKTASDRNNNSLRFSVEECLSNIVILINNDVRKGFI